MESEQKMRLVAIVLVQPSADRQEEPTTTCTWPQKAGSRSLGFTETGLTVADGEREPHDNDDDHDDHYDHVHV